MIDTHRYSDTWCWHNNSLVFHSKFLASLTSICTRLCCSMVRGRDLLNMKETLILPILERDLPWFWQLSALHGRRSFSHRVPWKPAEHWQLNPFEGTLVLLQIPAFWHDWRVSQGALGLSQLTPMLVTFKHGDGVKDKTMRWATTGESFISRRVQST